MPDLKDMHPREVVRGLMRGDRAELKLGYSPANAVSTAKRVADHYVHVKEERELELYAQGYSDGLQRAAIMASQGDTPSAETDAYCAGYVHGLLEDQTLTYPSKQPV